MTLAFTASLLIGVAVAGVSGGALPTGVQSCTTRCQTSFTDCVQACDGRAGCEEACEKRVSACVEVCKKPPPPKPPEGEGKDKEGKE